MAYYGLDAEEYDRTYTDKELLSRIIKIFSPYRNKMLLIGLFMVLNSISFGVIPLLTKQIIDQIQTTEYFIPMVITVIIITLLLNLFNFVSNFVLQSVLATIVSNVTFDLRSQSNYSVLLQNLSFYDKYPTGKIVSRISNDAIRFGDTVYLIIKGLSSLLVLLVLIIPMFMISAAFSSFVFILVPILFVITFSFRKVVRKKTLLGQRSLASLNAFFQETLSGIQIAKTFRQEEKLMKEFQTVNTQNYKVSVRRDLTMEIIWPFMNLVVGLLYTFLLFLGGNAIVSETFSVGDFYLIFQSFGLLFNPILQLVGFWPQFQQGLSGAERIFSLQDAEKEIKDGDYVFSTIRGKIEFKNFNFSYVPGKPVFENFNLTIQPGESLAIVGHTGAGKTTLARLLLRLYDFPSENGSILIDGKNIKDLKLSEYRRKVGYIGQVPFLWNDTIKNNIKFGLPNASHADVIRVLEQSGGVEWVEELDNGLETQIMERGKLLSMGQKQLLIFARVLLQNPSILILDEATASIDPFTETKILETMENVIKDRTTIVIAHRLVTVRHVDRIIVLDHGKIVEEGNHEQLMEKGGYYAELYDTYFRHQSYEFLEDMSRKKAEFSVEEN